MNTQTEAVMQLDKVADCGRGDKFPDKEFEIIICYNGLDKPLSVLRDEQISSVLAKAIEIFGNLPQPHTLALFTKDGGELSDSMTVEEVKIGKHDKVLLRPSTVKAG